MYSASSTNWKVGMKACHAEKKSAAKTQRKIKRKEAAADLVLAMERQLQNIKRRQLEADRKYAAAANQVTSPSEYNITALNVNATNNLPIPEGWITPDNSAQKDNAPALINTTLDDDLKWKVINVEV